MNKKRKMQYYFIIFCIVALCLLMVYIVGSTIHELVSRNKESHQVLAEFNELYEKEETQVILFASPVCKWCKQFVPVLDELASENDFEYYYLDVTKVVESDLSKIEEKTGLTFNAIPHLVILKNKKVIGDQTGAESKETTYELLKKTEIIKGESEDAESISPSS